MFPTRNNRPCDGASGRALRIAAFAFLFLAASRVPAATLGPQPPALPAFHSLCPHVVTRLPDFTLADQRGMSRTLTSLMGPKGLMLVFIRSADW